METQDNTCDDVRPEARLDSSSDITSIDVDLPSCRICLEAHVAGGQLLSPCRCTGSAQFAHDKCILKWYLTTGKSTCELCLAEINIHAKGSKPLHKWKFPRQSNNAVACLFVIYTVLLAVFLVLIGWVAFQQCFSAVCIAFYSISILSLSYFVYCCGCGSYMRRYRKSLLMKNRAWTVEAGAATCQPTTTSGSERATEATQSNQQHGYCFTLPSSFTNISYQQQDEQPHQLTDRLVRKTSAFSMQGDCAEELAATNNRFLNYDRFASFVIPTPDYNERRTELISGTDSGYQCPAPASK